MTPETVRRVFEDCQALLAGHFILSSGNHSNRYLQCALVTQYPQHAAALAEALVHALKLPPIDAVLGPALGGVVIAQEVAQACWRTGHAHVRALFCERVEGRMTLRRGFALKPGERVLVVEDVITTGGSVKEAVNLAREQGGVVEAVGCFIDRSVSPPQLGAPLTALLKVQAEIYPADACPLCQQGIPANKPGSRGLTR